jgi:hypothetical protein
MRIRFIAIPSGARRAWTEYGAVIYWGFLREHSAFRIQNIQPRGKQQSGIRESNPSHSLGKAGHSRYTNPATISRSLPASPEVDRGSCCAALKWAGNFTQSSVRSGGLQAEACRPLKLKRKGSALSLNVLSGSRAAGIKPLVVIRTPAPLLPTNVYFFRRAGLLPIVLSPRWEVST